MPLKDPATSCLPPVEALAKWPGRDYPLSPAGGQRVFVEPPDSREGSLSAPCAGRTVTFGTAREAAVLSALVAQLRRDWPSAEPSASSAGGLDAWMAAMRAQDLVVMACEPEHAAHQARAVYVNVARPSGWCPTCALGRGFAALHGPVPAIAPFRTGPQRRALAQGLFPDEPRVRFVWSVKPTLVLNRAACDRCPHPRPPSDWRDASAPVLRVERQVVLPVNDRLSAFLIRVTELPLHELTAPYRRALARVLTSMPQALAAYKGIDVPQALVHLT